MARRRTSKRPSKSGTRKSRTRKSMKQKGGSVLNYLLPFALWKVRNVIGKKTRKRKSRKSK